MELTKISKNEYNRIEGTKLSFTNLIPSTFAKVKGLDILISWQSDSIVPSFLTSDNYLLIGVDTNVAVVNKDETLIVCFLPLSSFFFNFDSQEGYIAVISELEVFILNKNSFSIRQYAILPDILEEYSINSNLLTVKCMNGHIVEIET